jgi:hypothetical protein
LIVDGGEEKETLWQRTAAGRHGHALNIEVKRISFALVARQRPGVGNCGEDVGEVGTIAAGGGAVRRNRGLSKQ